MKGFFGVLVFLVGQSILAYASPVEIPNEGTTAIYRGSGKSSYMSPSNVTCTLQVYNYDNNVVEYTISQTMNGVPGVTFQAFQINLRTNKAIDLSILQKIGSVKRNGEEMVVSFAHGLVVKLTATSLEMQSLAPSDRGYRSSCNLEFFESQRGQAPAERGNTFEGDY